MRWRSGTDRTATRETPEADKRWVVVSPNEPVEVPTVYGPFLTWEEAEQVALHEGDADVAELLPYDIVPNARS